MDRETSITTGTYRWAYPPILGLFCDLGHGGGLAITLVSISTYRWAYPWKVPPSWVSRRHRKARTVLTTNQCGLWSHFPLDTLRDQRGHAPLTQTGVQHKPCLPERACPRDTEEPSPDNYKNRYGPRSPICKRTGEVCSIGRALVTERARTGQRQHGTGRNWMETVTSPLPTSHRPCRDITRGASEPF